MREEILRALATDEEREVAAHIIDLVERSRAKQSMEASWFLSLSEQDLVAQIMRRYPDLQYIFAGGFVTAERKRLIIGPANADLTESHFLTAVRIRIKRGPDDELTHRDLFGAIMGLGLNRRYLGDVVVTADGGEVIAVDGIAQEIVRFLHKVGRFTAEAELIGLDDLSAGIQRKKLVKATVASLRLDAVAAAGFGKSRSQLVREINALRVRVNGTPARAASQPVKVGDVISIGGRGRIVVTAVGGQTKKNRTVVEIERYY